MQPESLFCLCVCFASRSYVVSACEVRLCGLDPDHVALRACEVSAR